MAKKITNQIRTITMKDKYLNKKSQSVFNPFHIFELPHTDQLILNEKENVKITHEKNKDK